MKIQSDINTTTSFQAKLIIKPEFNEQKRLKNICKIFAKNTKEYPNDVLTYEINDDYNIISEGVRLNNKSMLFFENSLNSMLEKFSDTEIVTKFTKALLCLKKEVEWSKNNCKFLGEIYNATSSINHHIKRARTIRDNGFNGFANVHTVLAKRNHRKLEILENLKQQKFDNYKNELKKIVDNDKDFNLFLKANDIDM